MGLITAFPYNAFNLLQRRQLLPLLYRKRRQDVAFVFEPWGHRVLPPAVAGKCFSLCCVFGLGESGKKLLCDGSLQAQEFITPVPIFLLREPGEQCREQLQKLQGSSREGLALSSSDHKAQHVSSPGAADHLGWCSGGISPPKSNENPSLCPVLLYMNGISTW